MLLLGVVQAQKGEVVPPAPTGSFDLLETTVLTSAESSVEFINLGTKYAAEYQHLQIRLAARCIGADNLGEIGLRFNGETGSFYNSHLLFGTGGSVISAANLAETSIHAADVATSNTSTMFGAGVVDILDPFETTKFTTTRALSGMFITANNFRHFIALNSGLFRSTDAATSITLFHRGGFNLAIGSRFSLYGIKAD